MFHDYICESRESAAISGIGSRMKVYKNVRNRICKICEFSHVLILITFKAESTFNRE